MTETLEPVAITVDQRELAEQLLEQAKAQGVNLVGPGGLLNELTRTVLETALEAEMTEHLGYGRHDPAGRGSGNSRNGTRTKTVLTEIGPVEIEVPRDTDSSFEPQIVKKRQRRLAGVDEIVLSLTAKGLTTGEVAAHFDDVYGAKVSKDTISRITDKVLAEMAEWANRPLDAVYPVVFIDAIHVKIRDGQVSNRPIYVAIGVTVAGERDILGLWAGDGGEGAKFWLQILTEIKNRGTNDVRIAVCDGLKGLPDAIGTAWPLAVVQTCVIHLLRNTFRYASRKYWDEMAKDLRPVYTAPTEAAAKERFNDFAGKWGRQYPAIVRMWDNAWSENAAVPRLRHRDPARHLLHQRHRVGQRPLPAGGPRPRALPHRAGGPEMPLSRDPFPGPDRQGTGTMGNEVEASAQRLRDRIRRPHQPERELTPCQGGSTVNQTVPKAGAMGPPPCMHSCLQQ